MHDAVSKQALERPTGAFAAGVRRRRWIYFGLFFAGLLISVSLMKA